VSGEIIVDVENGVGRLTLNRPQALHALNRTMCETMAQALLAWRDAPDIGAVLVRHAPETRGFCAGGDIRMIAESGAGDGTEARAFFRSEYRLNHLIHTYPKPYTAIMDGVTMGGGVGISVHGTDRIATERTLFAMPETGIGLFPDVGGGWFLPRLPGEIGTWLALTGARLKAGDCLAAGLATTYRGGQKPESILLTDEARAKIARHFMFDRVEDIIASLDRDGDEWALAQRAILATKSPQTLKVALRQMRLGATLTDFAAVMRMEYRIAVRVCRLPDLQEGVRAVVVDKDNAPSWSPATLEAVTERELDAIFAPLPEAEEWTPLPALTGNAP
jgi:enoyl-CoA hydratase